MSNLVVIPGKMEDINKILNKDIKGIILGVKSLSIYPLELDIDNIIDIFYHYFIHISIVNSLNFN